MTYSPHSWLFEGWTDVVFTSMFLYWQSKGVRYSLTTSSLMERGSNTSMVSCWLRNTQNQCCPGNCAGDTLKIMYFLMPSFWGDLSMGHTFLRFLKMCGKFCNATENSDVSILYHLYFQLLFSIFLAMQGGCKLYSKLSKSPSYWLTKVSIV